MAAKLQPPISLLLERVTQNLASAGATILVTDGSPVTPITSSGTYTITSVPTIANGRDGQVAILINTGSYAITLQDMGTLGGSNLRLGATTRALSALRGVLELVYDSTFGGWVEKFFGNVLVFTASVSGFTIDGSSAKTQEVAPATTSYGVPSFVVTYVGVPSVASIDIDAGGGEINAGDYPIALPSPYTSLTPSTTPPSKDFYKGTTIAQVRTFTITATVSGTGGLTKTLTITYYNSRYAGIINQNTALTSAQTVALGQINNPPTSADNSKIGSKAVNATAGNYVWFCYPSRLGLVSYWSMNSERAEMTRIGTGTVSVTNTTGYAETFEQYVSAIIAVGSVTIASLASAAANRVKIFKSTHTTVGTLTDAEMNSPTSSALQNTIPYAPTGANIPVTGAGEYIWYIYPSRLTYTTITFYVGSQTPGGMDGAGTGGATLTHVNQFGYSETYRAFRSDNPNLGTLSNWSVATT